MSGEEGKSNSTFTDIYNAYKIISDTYASFSLKESIASVRSEINEKLNKIPLKKISEPHMALSNFLHAHLFMASNYMHESYPYIATISRSHGYLISAAVVASVVVSPLKRLPKIIYHPLLYTSVIASLVGVQVINYKVDYPRNNSDSKKKD